MNLKKIRRENGVASPLEQDFNKSCELLEELDLVSAYRCEKCLKKGLTILVRCTCPKKNVSEVSFITECISRYRMFQSDGWIDSERKCRSCNQVSQVWEMWKHPCYLRCSCHKCRPYENRCHALISNQNNSFVPSIGQFHNFVQHCRNNSGCGLCSISKNVVPIWKVIQCKNLKTEDQKCGCGFTLASIDNNMEGRPQLRHKVCSSTVRPLVPLRKILSTSLKGEKCNAIECFFQLNPRNVVPLNVSSSGSIGRNSIVNKGAGAAKARIKKERGMACMSDCRDCWCWRLLIFGIIIGVFGLVGLFCFVGFWVNTAFNDSVKNATCVTESWSVTSLTCSKRCRCDADGDCDTCFYPCFNGYIVVSIAMITPGYSLEVAYHADSASDVQNLILFKYPEKKPFMCYYSMSKEGLSLPSFVSSN